jgi:hypothetical protein
MLDTSIGLHHDVRRKHQAGLFKRIWVP